MKYICLNIEIELKYFRVESLLTISMQTENNKTEQSKLWAMILLLPMYEHSWIRLAVFVDYPVLYRKC